MPPKKVTPQAPAPGAADGEADAQAGGQQPQPEQLVHVWDDVDATARALEKHEGQYGARVTHIAIAADIPPAGLWHGTYGNAAVVAGDTTIISLSDGRQFDAAGNEIPKESK